MGRSDLSATADRLSQNACVVSAQADGRARASNPHFVGVRCVHVCPQSKKPVNLGFLDFSSLEKRRHFCQRQNHCGAALDPLIDDLGDLLAEKCCAAGGWMADSMHFAAEFF